MPRYAFGPFELDPEGRVLCRNGEPIPMTGKMLDILLVLVENRGQLVDKEELLSRVWAGSVVEEGNLTQTIFTVRKILGDSPKSHHYIATVAGRGYQFVAPVEEFTKRAEAGSGERERSRKELRTLWRRNRLLRVGAGSLIAVLAAAIVLWVSRRSTRENEQSYVYRFTSYPGVEAMPAFSPDGKEIAYVRSEHDPIAMHAARRQVGQANIYINLVGAATELQLTRHPGADYYPTWSPDGQYVAFYRDRAGASGMYVVSALGGPERQITHEEVEIAGMEWLPDGHHLVISNFSEKSHLSPLMELSLDTGQQRPLTSPPADSLGDIWPAISPDEKTLAFVRIKASRAVHVCFMPVSGGALRCWPLQGHWPGGLAWTPSGDGIIVSAVRTGPHQLWRYRLDGGTPAALTSGEEGAVSPTISRATNRLAYVLHRRTVNVWGLDAGSSGSVNPTDARPIASSTREHFDPALSPDGRDIAFLSDQGGGHEIWVAKLETQSSTQLTHFGGPPTGSPSWSPDGLQIAFDSEQGAGHNIYVTSADGGVPRRITAGPGDNCVPSWSRDGKSIYFASDRSGELQIWMVPATGETPSHPAIQVTRGGGFRAFESIDGKYLYYAKGRGKTGLWRRNLSDGKEEPVLESLQEWGWWALGRESIYFFELPGSIHPQVHLKFLDIARHRIRDFGTVRYPVMNGTTGITVSRDGRHLTYTQIDPVEDDIMLREEFR